MYGHACESRCRGLVRHVRSLRATFTNLSLSFTHQNPGSALIHAPTLFWAGYSGQRRTESIVVD